MASLAANIPLAQATSLDQSHTIVVRSSYQRDDWRRLQLNDAVEDVLSKILRFGFDIDRVEVAPATAKPLRSQLLAWAKHIAGDIPGYTNWQEIYSFTFDALYVADAVPGSDDTPIGTEADLVAELQDVELERDYALQSKAIEKEHLADHVLSLGKARTRQGILDNIAARYAAANPMPPALALLFRKIRYTYKLRECLLGQVGYYNGSLELAADMHNEFEYHMYLIQMHLRRPDRLHKFKAPKAMAYYTTDETSLLPWNNQFSFSYGYDEFGPQQMPIFGINYIERKLVEVLRLDVNGKKWRGLCTLLEWDPQDAARVAELSRIKTEFVPAERAGLPGAAGHFLGGNLTLSDCGFRVLTLPRIITIISNDETRRKAFYTLFLGLTWSDTPLSKEENPFAEIYQRRARRQLRTGVTMDYDLAHLKDSDVKDPRIAADRPAILTLNLAHFYPQVVGRKANFILTPETASADYRRKLQRLSEAQLDELFINIATYPRTASFADKVNAIVKQAVEAAIDWQNRAVENHRPIYTGTSGHMLSYSRIVLSNIDPQGCANANHPTLEQFRLTLLAAIIGFNQHHTYDECMVASHGLTHGGITLKYTDRIGYRDIIDSTDSFIRNKVGKPLLRAMIAIGKQFIANFEEHQAALEPSLPHPGSLVVQWFNDTTGRDFAA
ncbi:uncharacterized protein EI90DRAFT_3076686 [Cantharellus anzutake]|uniref:uncharacterized protein n=1 Tax=Cantharellus anzutake TaxID=1750568 RepID=UPI001902CBBD|nr:uncharacterized protein EI90DRAFT_3076686 [Cantharellus anzutake]KAF8323456.1 hypothetical protein EI90DRAFT_3076686 [Cantharellus anzutake]